MKLNLSRIIKLVLTVLILVWFTEISFSQVKLRKVGFVYKEQESGRIISEKEFQKLKGAYRFHKIIKGRKDTMIISIPNPTFETIEDLNEAGFSKLRGNKAPEFNVIDIFGNSWNNANLKGKIVVLNFWFVACSPCIAEIPHLNKLVEEFKSENVAFLAFALDNEERIGKFLAETLFNYSIVPDSKPISEKFFITQYPTHIIIDDEGVMRYSKVGFDEKGILLELTEEVSKWIGK